MRTRPDLLKQAQTEISAALAKRMLSKKLWQEAEEELAMANIKLRDAINEQKQKQVQK